MHNAAGKVRRAGFELEYAGDRDHPAPSARCAPRRLHEASAQGTRASVLYAFGMHINPEIPSDHPAMLRDVLRAFVLLYAISRADALFASRRNTRATSKR